MLWIVISSCMQAEMRLGWGGGRVQGRGVNRWQNVWSEDMQGLLRVAVCSWRPVVEKACADSLATYS